MKKNKKERKKGKKKQNKQTKSKQGIKEWIEIFIAKQISFKELFQQLKFFLLFTHFD